MEDYISISTLNDFIFCPYSIYLHNVYMDTDEGLYQATPQTRGKIAHNPIDNKKSSNRSCDLQSLPVISEEYRLVGKIDIYKGNIHQLIERKYQLKHIYKGHIAIRLQFSVYEINNTQRVVDNIRLKIIDKFSKLFSGADSVMIFDAPNAKVQKFGNAIHRDQEVTYL